MTISEKLKELGYSTVSDSFFDKVEEWRSWYEGDVKKFSWYKVKTGKSTVKCKRYSLGMAKKVCEDWASLWMNEKVNITLEGEKEQSFINKVFEENNFAVKINEMQEAKAALGTCAYVPRVVGQTTGENAKGIEIDYVTAEYIRPLSWKNGVVQECAFLSTIKSNGQQYLYLQIHKKGDNGNYVIENRAYSIDNDSLTETPLANVPGYESIPPVVRTNSDMRLFVIDRPNISNNVEIGNPMGIAVYANAIDVLRGVDIAYDSYVNEFILGKKRILVKPGSAEFIDGEPAFDSDDVVFYVLPEDVGGDTMIEAIDMDLRTEEHSKGIQDQLNMLSSKCGFGENHYRFGQGGVATATQVVSENSSLFRNLKKHEIVLNTALTELCRILLRLGNTALGLGLDENVEMSIDFDDSIIDDKESDFNRDLRLLSAGIMNDWEFRAKWMNEDEDTAKKMLPKMESMTTEGQSEIE